MIFLPYCWIQAYYENKILMLLLTLSLANILNINHSPARVSFFFLISFFINDIPMGAQIVIIRNYEISRGIACGVLHSSGYLKL